MDKQLQYEIDQMIRAHLHFFHQELLRRGEITEMGYEPGEPKGINLLIYGYTQEDRMLQDDLPTSPVPQKSDHPPKDSNEHEDG